MSTSKRLIKIFAFFLAGVIIVNIFGLLIKVIVSFLPEDEKLKYYEQSYNSIKEIVVDARYSKVVITKGNNFNVVGTDMKTKLTSKVNDGVLTVTETSNKFWNVNSKGVINITVKDNVILNELEIKHGAGSLDISSIAALNFELEQGAGRVVIDNVSFDKTNIDGGVGEIIVTSSRLNNLDMDLGVGHASIEANILGKNEIDCGVGAVDINLLNNIDDYTIRVDKGIGSVKIDGVSYKDGSVIGTGANSLLINGGIGSIDVKFN